MKRAKSSKIEIHRTIYILVTSIGKYDFYFGSCRSEENGKIQIVERL